MSILGMIDARINKQRQWDLFKEPTKRAEVREACSAVLRADTDTEEYERIVALQRLLPNT